MELGGSLAHTCPSGLGFQKEGIKDYLSGSVTPSQLGFLPPPQPFPPLFWFAAPVNTHRTIFSLTLPTTLSSLSYQLVCMSMNSTDLELFQLNNANFYVLVTPYVKTGFRIHHLGHFIICTNVMTIHAIAVRTFLKKTTNFNILMVLKEKLRHRHSQWGLYSGTTTVSDNLTQFWTLWFFLLRLSRLLSIVASCWYHTFIHEYAFLLTVAFEHYP